MRITDISIDRPVFATMVAFACMVLGLMGYSRLGVDLFPDMSFPLVIVVTPYPGASPEEVETGVSRRIEEAVASIKGVDEIRSASRDSFSTVTILFDLNADARRAANDVRDRVAMIRGLLPRDVLDPVISRVDPTAIPVATYAVSSPRSSLETRALVDDVIGPAVERVDGVGAVNVIGGDVREIRVELDRARLEELGLTVSAVSMAIGAESFDVPAGRITVGSREVGLTSVGRFRTVEEIGEVVLMARPDGTQIRVRDVGKVIDGVVEARTISRVDGASAVTFDVQKQAGTNTIAIVDGVDAAIAGLGRSLPPDVKLTKVIDTSQFIRNNNDHLREHLLLGGSLAILVIFLFMLDFRSTLISAIALPTSVITTFFVIWLLGYTLNIMTMMALTLAIGLLIDDSVVVRENIFRHMEMGEDPVTAARKGTSQIALAVLATSATILAVFVPVAFTGGMIGNMFRQFGITMSVAVIVSTVVSLTLDPMMSARITQKIDPDRKEKMGRNWFYGPILRALDANDRGYKRILGWTLRHRKTTFFAVSVIFVGSLLLAPLLGREFFGRGDMGDFSVNIELPAGTSLAETSRMTTEVEAIISDIPEVATIATTVGPNEEVNKAKLRVKATHRDTRTRLLKEIMEELRPKLNDVPGLVYNMREAGLGGSMEDSVAQAPVLLYISGAEYTELGRIATEAWDAVRSTSGVRDPAISYRPGLPEERIVLDRTRAGDLGVSFASVGMTLRAAVEGNIVGKFRDGNKESDIRVRLRDEDRDSVRDVRALTVPSRTGRPVFVAEVTRSEPATTPATIERLDRERFITISANVVGRSLGDVINDIESKLAKIDKAAGYGFRFSGEAERMQETMENMGLALGLAILFIYFVLASQFESFIHPLTIMMALPLAIVGALSALFLFKHPLGMPAMIGIILLMGLVTKNSILLVDYTIQLRNDGMELIPALLMAAPIRLRPILMTSAAVILGMLPTAVSTAEGAEFRVPMSIAVIGGVITSTFLTLVVVPTVYVWMDRLTLRGRRERREAKARAKGAGAAAPSPSMARIQEVPATSGGATGGNG